MGECAGSPPNENNEISKNTSIGNGTSGQGSGIKLFSTPSAVAPRRNTIADNVTDDNATNGISVDSGGPGVGATENTIIRNKAHGNRVYDAADGNTDTPCDANVWKDNDFGTVNQQCVGGTQTQPPPTPPGTIVISGADPSTDAGAVFRIDPAMGTATMISSAGDLATPVGVAVEATGDILVVDADAFGGAGGIIRLNPLTGTQTTVSEGGLFSNPFDLVVETGGSILVVDPHASRAGGVIRVDPDTGEQVMVSSGQETGPATALREVGIALEADGAIVVVEQSLAGGRPGNGRVTRIDPTTGDRTPVSEGGAFSSPAGVVVEASGGILVADADAFGDSGGVIRVDPVTGEQTEVSSGGTFASPIGIALETDGGILVADTDAFSGSGAVIRVDPVTGAQTTVSAGGTFRGPRAVVNVPATVTVPPPTTSPPSQVANVTAAAGGGSGEVQVTWDPNPPAEGIAFYRVYERNGPGTYWQLAVVTDDALGLLEPDRLGIVDAVDFWPWPSGGVAGPERCYVVTAVSLHGLEGPFSAEVCASPVGG
ncbi:MAG: right-handed parallel beta-helix repeat-containing protein [Actinobacteria bacterium]|nr:right-handed parallel beta-helix repeat-containing protein [Actinomycetota bacterium]